METEELCRIELAFLPTYSPWLNPIEKLRDWLKADVLKMHRLAGQWDEREQRIAAFLEQFADGSNVLPQRVGLTAAGKLAKAIKKSDYRS